jgi:CTP:phosphocholine cytidylyltransferase-like protein
MTTNVKANLSSIRIFPGYSPQQLSYMLYQTNMPITFKELYKQYSNLSADLHQSIFIDCINADYVFYS